MKFFKTHRKLLHYLIFGLFLIFLINMVTDILVPKSKNRYYILEKYLEKHHKENNYDVQVFGSCHSYTSFNPIYLEKKIGVSAFVYGNPGEIIPVTYIRMYNNFRKYVPKIALVEIWGINPYETYDSSSRIFGHYLLNNLERTSFCMAKQEVIMDFRNNKFTNNELDFIPMNFPVVRYKDRILDGSLTDVDFKYNFKKTKKYSSKYVYNEMSSRLENKGFKVNKPRTVVDYPKKQNYIFEDEFLEIEPDIVKYIYKIIDLCNNNGVKLIFYRSPYCSKINELKKLSHLRKICENNKITFIDLEKEISFNYYTDFIDYAHLSYIGANKATDFLSGYIFRILREN